MYAHVHLLAAERIRRRARLIMVYWHSNYQVALASEKIWTKPIGNGEELFSSQLAMPRLLPGQSTFHFF